ncbi:ankyrin repeat and LEM domain-containing protein 2-like [Panonychus citri]|uniref:ankyrin repeat and LEM domain-containing protein 2-like n=1 Tax=Panonychus citri TaxID=50023 RepID=UPI0023072F22|nr:ankyrin repeat and LEM domain-containing protein 2-like [Panonychus citri]
MTDSPVRQSQNSSLTPRSAKFISVMLPKSVLSNNQEKNTSIEDLVLTDQSKAFTMLKQNKGSRIRMFDNYEDAFNCSLEGISDPESNREPSKEKVAANFPTPSPPELSVLRRAIERGDLDSIRSQVSTNPKFLITTSDTPVILMEGPRYNAVHIASKFNQVEILDFILKTVNSPTFIKTLYPNDSDEITEATMKRLLDLYLNTPDKAALDTPLHFATKFAAVDCVKLLLSYPDCDRGRPNKFNQVPYDVICSRKNDEKAKKQIKDHFEARFYVAINREFDRVTVCKPSETPPLDNSISGIAGPMSPKLAEEIYNTLKSPPKASSPRKFRIRFTDGSRGVERVASMECRRLHLNWVEYWPFLDCYIDLTSPEGLEMLENHLKKVHKDLTSKQPDEEESSRLIESLSESNSRDQSTISYLCDRLGSLALISTSQEIKSQADEDEDANEQVDDVQLSDQLSSDEESDESYMTPPSSPIIQVDYYVNGSLMTQSDRDAANALAEINIDQFRYPYLAQWLRKVKLKQPIPSPFKETHESSFSKEMFNFVPTESTPRTRKSINLIDLITPRRYSFNDHTNEEDKGDDDDDDENDVFQDSVCHLTVDISDDSYK